MFHKHQYQLNGLMSVYSTEGCFLKRERILDCGFSCPRSCECFGDGSGQQAHSGSHPDSFPKQRLVCGTDRGHLVLLRQFLQLVGFVLCLYESLLHIIQCLDKRGVGIWWAV